MLLFALPAFSEVNGTVRVVDGVTLDIGGVRVRLFGIDAPEIDQSCETSAGESWDCGTWVSTKMSVHFDGATASCDPMDQDRYGRIVAVCHVSGADIGQMLVRRGMAVAFRRYSDAYVQDETLARRDRIGLHAGTFKRPADYRRSLSQASNAPVEGCRIKGNINRSGERIFHLSGQKYYAATKIQKQSGERWFCTEAEARAAGWRKSKR